MSAADPSGYARYAIYAAPAAESPLAQFCAAWLGYDAERGAPLAHPAVEGLPRPAAELTETPRRYGLHGTLKAPFRLAEGCRAVELVAALDRFADERPAPAPVPLRLAADHGFVALRPGAPTPDLDALAAAVVEAFDPFRAPTTPEDRARRRPERLTAAQLANLDRWGYPYTHGEFGFHLTLSGALDAEAAEATIAALRPKLAPLLARPEPFGELCLFGDPGGGAHFRLLSRHRLRA